MGISNRVELNIPSILGFEKIAIDKAASIAKKMGFSDDRVEDLKTAVSEACINAIEHGNKFNLDTKVGITFAVEESGLQVIVHDEGDGINPQNIPKDLKDEKGFPKRRGYGVFLIKNLVSELFFVSKPGEGNEVRMLIHLENDKQHK